MPDSPAGNPTTASQEKGDSTDVGNVIKLHSAPAGDARTPASAPSEAGIAAAIRALPLDPPGGEASGE